MIRNALDWLCLTVFAAVVAILAFNAFAAPPPGADPNSELGQWFRSLTVPHGSNKGASCCSVADCRPVDYKQDQDGYIILIGKQFGADIDPHWERVPQDAILERKDNPLGRPVACYYHGQVRCFVAPSET